ncbi:MAG: aminoacyl-tRNA deacylase [Rhodospirillaceae bacterium]
MAPPKVPSTPAVLALRAARVPFAPHFYTYEERGGTAVSSRELGVDEHAVVKTLVMADENERPLIVLMHGDMKVSTKALARTLGVKRVEPCRPDIATKHSGYQVGGTSPFGTRKRMPVYVERTILTLPRIYINGGSRGFLVEIDPAAITAVLGATPVDVAIPD